MTIFYHFTSADALFGIGLHGLTVGDVPTDIRKGRGVIGIWLTTSEASQGHGLDRSGRHKRRYRLAVDLPPDAENLHSWQAWSARHATAETVVGLHGTADAWPTWWIFLGVIKPSQIVGCFDTEVGVPVSDWQEILTEQSKAAVVPPWRRTAWQKKMLKQVTKALQKR
ncbi:hypothetical protein EOA13_22110 [Mesorhizobium sp. M7A.F.Ca.US.011.01.1.1]|uniref:hypothetical protein n=1 Tax=Mesorhizobium sp. M7A.F.Ca.US.011.01.1.1 TaxID=2496741 RepID=UPI000FCBE0FF|nr:hypothetical protein [Mesorhizobium sp. M7A.F.Ca.US.011.01.1.1]RUX26815.1 hypothetical protein EOA13_22110 [Mesorhizobium sp. M7A.F.Ca.US.011.01.1.1]